MFYLLLFHIQNSRVDQYLTDDVADLVARFRLNKFYEALAFKYPNAPFCRFSCVLLRKCRDTKPALQKLIVNHVHERVLGEPNFIENFEGVDTKSCITVLKQIPRLETTINGKILKMIKSIHSEYSRFAQLQERVQMFKICAQNFFTTNVKACLDGIYDCFAKMQDKTQIRLFIENTRQIDPWLHRNLTLKWIETILSANDFDALKVYFELLLGKIISGEFEMKILTENLNRLTTVDKMSSVYNHLERLDESSKFPRGVSKILRRHRKRFVKTLELPFDAQSWEVLLAIKPKSKFSRQCLDTMAKAFDQAVRKVPIEQRPAFGRLVSDSVHLSEREKGVLAHFVGEVKQSAREEQGFAKNSETQELAAICKLCCDPQSRSIFETVIRACQENAELKGHFRKSKLIHLLLDLAKRVILRQISRDQIFLISHFNLQIALRNALVFSEYPIPESGVFELNTGGSVQRQQEFDSTFATIADTIEILRKEEKSLHLLKSEPLLKELFDPKQIQRYEQIFKKNKFFRETWKAVKSSGLDLSSIRFDKLELLDSPLKRRIFLLQAFQRGFFNVFSGSCKLPAEDLELLCRYFDFGRKELPCQSAYLGFGQVNDMFLEVENYHSYLTSKYIQPGLDAVNWDEQYETGKGLPENPLLFDFLLRNPDRDGGSQAQDENAPAEQSKMASLKTQIGELTCFRSVGESLQKLPGQLQPTVEEHFPRMSELGADSACKRHSLKELYRLKPAMSARISELHALAQDPGLAKMLVDELKQEIASICTDPLSTLKAGSEPKDCSPNALATPMAGDSSGVVARMLMSKIRAQEARINALEAALSEKQNERSKIDRSSQIAKTKNKKLKAQATRRKKENRELRRKNKALLQHLHYFVKLTGIATRFGPNPE